MASNTKPGIPTPEEILEFYQESCDEESCDEESGDEESGDEEPHDQEPRDQESLDQESRDQEPRKHESCEGKSVVICGPGQSLGQLFAELGGGVTGSPGSPGMGDEIWATDSLGKLIKYDRLFFMEHPSMVQDSDWLSEAPGTIYVSEATSGNQTEYPIREVVDTLGLLYINSSAAYAIALAICRRAAKIRLFGLDFDTDPGKRGCIEFLICKAVHSAVNVEIPSSSSLLGNNLSMNDRLFGFKHCKDPFVMGAKEGRRCLMRVSELPDQHKVA
jgi:hypothetical protein